MASNHNQSNYFDFNGIQNSSSNIYGAMKSNIISTRFIEELTEVIQKSRIVEDMLMIFELRQALSIEQQNVNDKNAFLLPLVENNQHIVLAMVQIIEQFIENRSIDDILKLYIDEDINNSVFEHVLDSNCFCKNLNGLMVIFNENHCIVIQLIEQNNSTTKAQFQQRYTRFLYTIEQNTTFKNCPVVLSIARKSYQLLCIVVKHETTACIQTTVETNAQQRRILVRIFDCTLWLIVVLGIIIFGTFLIIHDDKIINTMGVGFIFLSIIILMR